MATKLETKPTQSANKTSRVDQYVGKQLKKTTQQVRTSDIVTGVIAVVSFIVAFFLIASIVDAWVLAFSPTFRIVLLGAFLIGMAAIAWVFVFPFFFKRINPQYAAKVIEEAKPEFKNSILNYLMLKNNNKSVHKAVLNEVSRRAATDLTKVTPDAAVDKSNLIRAGFMLVGLAAIAVAYAIFSPKNPLPTILRILSPGSKISKPAAVSIVDVNPGDTSVFFGDRLDVSAKVTGIDINLDEVRLIYSTNDSQIIDAEVVMKSEGPGGIYKAVLETGSAGIQQPLNYRIEAGDGESPVFSVNVRPNPTITVEQIKITPPKYTQLTERIIEGNGDIQAVEGSQVEITATANLPIELAYIVPLIAQNTSADQSNYREMRTIQMKSEKNQAVGRIVAALNSNRDRAQFTHYKINFRSTDNFRNEKPNIYPIRVVADLAPEVQIVEPVAQEVSIPANQPFSVQVWAADLDYEISSIDVQIDHNGSKIFERNLFKKNKKPQRAGERISGRLNITPEQLHLQPGDKAILFATAADNRISATSQLLDPNVTRTENYTLVITAPVENPEQPQEPDDNDQQQDPDNENPEDQQTDNQNGEKSSNGGNDENGEGGQEGEDGNSGSDAQTPGDENGENQNDESQQGTGSDGTQQNSNQPEQDDQAGSENQNESGSQSSSSSQDGNSSGENGGQASSETGDQDPAQNSEPQNGGSSQASSSQDQDQQNQSNSGSDQSAGSKQQDRPEQSDQDSSNKSGSQNSQGQDTSQQSGGKESPGQEGSLQDSNDDQQNSDGSANSDSGAQRDSSSNQKGRQSDGNSGDNGGQSSNQEVRDENLTDGATEPLHENASEGDQFEQLQKYMGDKQQENGSKVERQSQAPDQQPNSENTRDGNRQSTDSQEPDPESDQNSDESTGESGRQESGSDGSANESESSNDGEQKQSSTDEQNNGEQAENGDSSQQSSDPNEAQDSSPSQSDDSESASNSENSDPAESQKRSDSEPPSAGQAGQQDSAEQQSSENPSQSKEQEGESAEATPSQSDTESQSDAQSSAQNGDSSNSNSSPQSSNSDGNASPQENGEQFGKGGSDGSRKSADQKDVPPSPDKVNLDYTKKVTDLVLDELENQKYDPDPELLRRMNWTQQDLDEFLKRWQLMKKQAESGDLKAKRRYEDAQRSLGLSPKSKIRKANVKKEKEFTLNEDGAVDQIPPHLRNKFNSYLKRRNRSQRN